MLDNISKNISNWSSIRICSILEIFILFYLRWTIIATAISLLFVKSTVVTTLLLIFLTLLTIIVVITHFFSKSRCRSYFIRASEFYKIYFSFN